MKVDNIESIVNELDKLPYKCILFDGTWEIGYMEYFIPFIPLRLQKSWKYPF